MKLWSLDAQARKFQGGREDGLLSNSFSLVTKSSHTSQRTTTQVPLQRAELIFEWVRHF